MPGNGISCPGIQVTGYPDAYGYTVGGFSARDSGLQMPGNTGIRKYQVSNRAFIGCESGHPGRKSGFTDAQIFQGIA